MDVEALVEASSPRILTFVSARFIPVLFNWLAHRSHAIEARPNSARRKQKDAPPSAPNAWPPVEIHALDDATHDACQRAVPTGPNGRGDVCIRDGCCHANQSQDRTPWRNDRRPSARRQAEGFRLVEAVLMHRLELAVAELGRRPRPLLILDATALIASKACLDEWLSYPEDIVATMELNGCPAAAVGRLGGVVNMGGVLLRPGSRAFLAAALRRRGAYATHCYDQEVVNMQMLHGGFRWLDYPRVGIVPPTAEHGGVTIRLLDYVRWPRDFGPQWFRNRTSAGKGGAGGGGGGEEDTTAINNASGPRASTSASFSSTSRGRSKILWPVPWDKHERNKRGGTTAGCFFHPYVRGPPSAHADVYARHKLWYL